MTSPGTPNPPFPSRDRDLAEPRHADVDAEFRGEAEGRSSDIGMRPAQHPPADATQELPAELTARRRRRTRRRVPATDTKPRRNTFTARERLLILDTWIRSKLPAKDYAALVGVSAHTLYKWRQRFEEDGPAGLEDKPKGPGKGQTKLSDATQRAILLMKETHADWGQDRIHSMLARTQGLAASPGAIGRFLEQQGYVVEDVPTKRHPDKPRRFERSRPNQLWQTDLFTFVLKRQGRRVHLTAFMDDHSRFIVGYGLHASSSGSLVREVLEAAIANHGAPEEVLTDNGTQYKTWRGKSAFTKLLERRGIKQIVATPRHPQTLGKIERFWGTLWRECVEQAIFRDLDDARDRIGLFVDHYNFQRTHSGIDGLVPADRFFASAPQVRATLEQRVAANAKSLATHGTPRKPFYLTGRVGDSNISLHAEGERVVLTKEDGSREEVDLGAPGRREEDVEQALPDSVAAEGVPEVHPAIEHDACEGPGESPLDGVLRDLRDGLTGSTEEADDDE